MRPLRWSVDLSPAEFAYVEQARAVLHASRSEFVVRLAADVQQRLAVEAPALSQARAVVDAEKMLFEEGARALDATASPVGDVARRCVCSAWTTLAGSTRLYGSSGDQAHA